MISIRDLVIIVAAIVSVVLAWGLERTRLSVAENQISTILTHIEDDRREHKEIELQVDKLEEQLHDIERDSNANKIKIEHLESPHG